MTTNAEKPDHKNENDIETFDMYRFLSRWDVLAIVLISVALMLYNLYLWAFAPLPPA